MVIGSTGIILKDRKILMVKRSNYTNAFPNMWGFPGGRADGEETAEEAVKREVMEKTGLEFTPTKLFSTAKYKDQDLHRFLGEWSGEVKLQEEELTEHGWFSYDEAKKLELAFEYKDVIEKLHKEELI